MNPKINKEFLDILTDEAKRRGWDYDYIEISKFIEALYHDLDLKVPDLEPYEVKEE